MVINVSTPVDQLSPDEHEILTPPSEELFLGYLNGVANHEGKLLTAAIILSNPDMYFDNLDLQKEVRTRQEGTIVWPVSSSLNWKYCDECIEPIGMLVRAEKTNLKGEVVPAFTAEPDHVTFGLAATGLLFEGALKYPGYSVQRILGASNSPSGVRSPETRLQMYLYLLSRGEEGASMVEMYDALDGLGYARRESFESQMHTMQDRGLLTISSKLVEHNPSFRVAKLKRKLASNVRDYTSALYRAREHFGEGTLVTLEELVEKAIEIDPNIDPRATRNLLTKHFVSSVPAISGLSPVVSNERPKSAKTRVKIAEEAIKAIRDLCERLVTIRDGSVDLSYVNFAKEVIASPDLFRTLLAKARANSPYVQGQKEGTEKLESDLTAVIKEAGLISVAAATRLLFLRTGREVNQETARNAILRLVKKGVLSEIPDSVKQHADRRVKGYEVKKDET